jgi:L-fuconolactonase
MIIDAHHHLWDYDAARYPWMTSEYAPIRRRFSPDDLLPMLTACGVSATVLVQTCSSLDETRTFLEVGAGTPFIAGVVGWVDLASANVVETIGALQAGATGRKLVGIRHQVHDEPDPAWLLHPTVQRGVAAVGLAGLAFDLLVRPRELPSAHATAVRHPEIRFVLDHLAKPPIRAGGSAVWDAWMPRMAELPNVYCKLSGLVTEADWQGWSVEQLRPYVERAVSWFGPTRLMFGSDWPVCLVAASYARVLATARALVQGLPPAQQQAIFGETAAAVYRLRLT